MDHVTNSLTKRTQGKQAQLPGKPSVNCHTHLVTSGPSHDKEIDRCGRVGPQDDSELIAEDQQGMLPRPSSSGLVTLSGARMVTPQACCLLPPLLTPFHLEQCWDTRPH